MKAVLFLFINLINIFIFKGFTLMKIFVFESVIKFKIIIVLFLKELVSANKSQFGVTKSDISTNL